MRHVFVMCLGIVTLLFGSLKNRTTILKIKGMHCGNRLNFRFILHENTRKHIKIARDKINDFLLCWCICRVSISFSYLQLNKFIRHGATNVLHMINLNVSSHFENIQITMLQFEVFSVQ